MPFRTNASERTAQAAKPGPMSGFEEQQCSKTEASTSEKLRWRTPAQLCAKAHTRVRNPKGYRINTVLIAIWKHNKGIPEQSHYMLILGISVRFSHQVCGRTVFFSSFWESFMEGISTDVLQAFSPHSIQPALSSFLVGQRILLHICARLSDGTEGWMLLLGWLLYMNWCGALLLGFISLKWLTALQMWDF